MAEPFDSFNPATTRYSGVNALVMAHFAKAAYLAPARFTAFAARAGFDGVTAFSESPRGPVTIDTQCFLAQSKSAVVLVFRGTEPDNLDDWLTDFTALPARFTPGTLDGLHAHAGFFHALHVVWPALVEGLKQLQVGGRTLWVTGHSLGAALATLAAARLASAFDWPINGVYTFGSPRACFVDLAGGYNPKLGQRTFRFVNDADVVTRVPTRKMGYSHVGQFLYLDARGQFSTDLHHWNALLSRIEVELSEFGELLTGRRRGLRSILRAAAPRQIADHAMAEYISKIAAKLDVDPFAGGIAAPSGVT
jgi:triacylglycerol lipase